MSFVDCSLLQRLETKKVQLLLVTYGIEVFKELKEIDEDKGFHVKERTMIWILLGIGSKPSPIDVENHSLLVYI